MPCEHRRLRPSCHNPSHGHRRGINHLAPWALNNAANSAWPSSPPRLSQSTTSSPSQTIPTLRTAPEPLPGQHSTISALDNGRRCCQPPRSGRFPGWRRQHPHGCAGQARTTAPPQTPPPKHPPQHQPSRQPRPTRSQPRPTTRPGATDKPDSAGARGYNINRPTNPRGGSPQDGNHQGSPKRFHNGDTTQSMTAPSPHTPRQQRHPGNKISLDRTGHRTTNTPTNKRTDHPPRSQPERTGTEGPPPLRSSTSYGTTPLHTNPRLIRERLIAQANTPTEGTKTTPRRALTIRTRSCDRIALD